ncbi:MAG TPA: biotin transporter BioY [Trueperaceae bacterium]|nr:biotin transporter BioY [Trueperaceae bacterium]
MSNPTLTPSLLDRVTRAVAPRADARVAAVVKVAVGVLVLALLAQVRVQIGPVPITGQTLGVLLLGAAYGLPLGLVSMGAYLALGAAGAPIFAGSASGLAYLAGPTGGYLAGFVFAAALLGYLSRRGWDKDVVSCALMMLLASVIIYVPGVTWLRQVLGSGWSAAFAAGVTPFLVGDAVKLAIATVALPGAWRLLGKGRR